MNSRYESLDLWRGVACLSVLVSHAASTPPDTPDLGWWHTFLLSGWMGVPIFFVISGYCITAALEHARTAGHPIREYWYRRLRRIFPPYWAALILCAALTAGVAALGHADWLDRNFDHPATFTPWQWLGSATLTEGWRGHIVWRGGYRWYIPIAWSLGYEEQFYLVAGALVLIAGRKWLHLSWWVTVAVGVAVLLGAWNQWRGFWFDGRWLMFAFGVGVYAQRSLTGPYRFLVPTGCAAAALYGLLQPDIGPHTFSTELVAAAFVAVLLIVLQPYDTRTKTGAPWLAWCGRRCYSIYLLHWPWAKLGSAALFSTGLPAVAVVPVNIGCAAVVTLATAAIFFRYIEEPCMRRPRSASTVQVGAAA